MRATVAIHYGEEEPVSGAHWVRWITSHDGLGMGVFQGVVRWHGCGSVLPGYASGTGDCLGCCIRVETFIDGGERKEVKGLGGHGGSTIWTAYFYGKVKGLSLVVVVIKVAGRRHDDRGDGGRFPQSFEHESSQ